MSESQSPAQAPPQAPSPQPQPQHEQSQEPASLHPYSSDTTIATARPASPFFRHRPLGRAPSPPTWACYEQIPARSEPLGSSDESDSDSGDEAADEDSLSDADCDGNPDDDPDDDDNSSLSDDEDDAEAAGLMDVEDDEDGSGDPEKRDKGKQRAEVPQTVTTTTTNGNGNGDGKTSPVIPHAPPPARHRRTRSRRPPVSALRPILTIQRSQGFVWNQVRALSRQKRIPCFILAARRISSYRPT